MRAEQDIINEIFRKNTQGYVDYAETAALQRVQATLQGLIDDSWEYVPQVVKKPFEATLSRQGYKNASELMSAQTVVVEQLIQNLMGEIIDSTNVAYNSARNLYQIARLSEGALRQEAIKSVAYTEALGKNAFYAGQSMEVAIRNKGITAFVDKRGREWSLTDYCSMATRTTARQAEVSAVLTADDHDLYQIVKIGSTCPICAPYEGRVYSKSGMDPNYPPLSLAFGKIDPNGGDDLSNTYLNIHPNCLVPGGSVLCEGIMAESRRLYSGKVITFETSTGNKISVTPNHPVLTDRGFVIAERLVEGDKIIEASPRYTSFFGEAPNDINIPSVVNEEFHSLMKSLSSSTGCVKGSAEQFHGDGGTDSEVNIILADALGAYKRQVGLDDKIVKKRFPTSKFRVLKLFAGGPFAKVIVRAFNTFYSFVSRLGFVGGIKRIAVYLKKLADLGARTIAHFGDLSKGISLIVKFKKMFKLLFVRLFEFFRDIIKTFSSGTRGISNTDFSFDSSNHMDWKIKFPADFRASEPLLVSRIEELLSKNGLVISVLTHKETSFYNGYVYNLETKYGYYAYNNIITHNCLHSIVKYTELGKTDKQIQKMRDFSNPETNPLDIDPRSKKQIKAYRDKERNRAQLRADIKQMHDYRDVLGSEVPKDITRFRKLKYEKPDKWAELKSEYRKTLNAMIKAEGTA
jgi:hypothetical protein